MIPKEFLACRLKGIQQRTKLTSKNLSVTYYFFKIKASNRHTVFFVNFIVYDTHHPSYLGLYVSSTRGTLITILNRHD